MRPVTHPSQLGKLEWGCDERKGIVYLGLGNGRAIDVTNGIQINRQVTQVVTRSVQNPASGGNGQALNINGVSGVLRAQDGVLLGNATSDDIPEGTANQYLSAAGLATVTHAATGKDTPIDADEVALIDSAATYGLKRLTWANLKATLKVYLDTVYAALTHATRHKSGGDDAIKLDELAAPTDVTTLNASASAHGLLPKLPNNTTTFLRGDGTYATPPAGTGSSEYINGGTASSTTSGTVHTYNLTGSPTVGAYTIGMLIGFKADATNASPYVTPKINLDGLGVKTIVSQDSVAYGANDIQVGHMILLMYNGSSMVAVAM